MNARRPYKIMSVFISASALKDFIRCEYMSYYRLFEPRKAIPTTEMLVGKLVHKVIEKEWRSREQALAFCDLLLLEYGMVELPYKNNAYHFINTYFDTFREFLNEDDQVEKRFKVRFTDGDSYLVGVFDRMTSNGIIYDWKTDANPPKNIDKEIQFIIYELAFKLLYEKDPSGLYLASLKNGSIVRYNRSRIHYETLITKIIPDYVSLVKTKQFVKTGLFNGSCYRCQYKNDCLRG